MSNYIQKYRKTVGVIRIQQHIETLNRRLTTIEEKIELRERTEMFWNLQLQFMELSSCQLVYMIDCYRATLLCIKNRKIKTINQIMYKNVGMPITKDEKDCLATYLALQLSGIEE